MSRTDRDVAAVQVLDLHKTFVSRAMRVRLRHRMVPVLSRTATRRHVLRGVNLEVAPGQVLGYVGRNGAGKTTTLRALVGVLHPDRGTIRIHGRSPHRDGRAVKRELGIVFGQRTQLWQDLTARMSFRVLADIYALPPRELERRLGELDDMFRLRDFWNTPVRHLSLGQRMQCDLAAAVLHRPRVLVLDEPTIGMDVVARGAFRAFIGAIKSTRDCTVLLTTHDMHELERLCDRLAILADGRITFDGTLCELHQVVTLPVTVSVRLAVPAVAADLPDLPTPGGATVRDWVDDTITYQVATVADVPALLAELSGRVQPHDIRVMEASLEDMVAAIYRQRHRGARDPVLADGRR